MTFLGIDPETKVEIFRIKRSAYKGWCLERLSNCHLVESLRTIAGAKAWGRRLYPTIEWQPESEKKKEITVIPS